MAILYFEIAAVQVFYGNNPPSVDDIVLTDPVTGITVDTGIYKWNSLATSPNGTNTYLRFAVIAATYTPTSAPQGTYSYTDAQGHAQTTATDIWTQMGVPDGFTIPSFGPVVSVHNVTLTRGQTLVAASSLFSVSDPAGAAITQYIFYDTGAGGGHFVLNGVVQATNANITINANQLGQLQYQGGSGTDTLWVEAYDGTSWSPWSNAFTVAAPVDPGPVETVSNRTATHKQIFTAASLFTYSDSWGQAATQYDFYDTGVGGGHFVLNGVILAANQDNIITAAQLSQLTYQSGSGADTLWVRANDGTVWGAWSNSFTITAPVNRPPVVTGSNQTLTPGHTLVLASTLFTATDPDGDAIAMYGFWNSGASGGH